MHIIRSPFPLSADCTLLNRVSHSANENCASKQIFCEVAYKATSRQDLTAGIEEYIDSVTVLPPSIWDPSTRLEPPKHTISMVGIINFYIRTRKSSYIHNSETSRLV